MDPQWAFGDCALLSVAWGPRREVSLFILQPGEFAWGPVPRGTPSPGLHVVRFSAIDNYSKVRAEFERIFKLCVYQDYIGRVEFLSQVEEAWVLGVDCYHNDRLEDCLEEIRFETLKPPTRWTLERDSDTSLPRGPQVT